MCAFPERRMNSGRRPITRRERSTLRRIHFSTMVSAAAVALLWAPCVTAFLTAWPPAQRGFPQQQHQRPPPLVLAFGTPPSNTIHREQSRRGRSTTHLRRSTLNDNNDSDDTTTNNDNDNDDNSIQVRWTRSLQTLRAKDRLAPAVHPDDLVIVYEDDDIIVIDKPSGVLSVPSEPGVHSIAEAVYQYCCLSNQQQQQVQTDTNNNNTTSDTHPNTISSLHHMVVHRLGVDTAGLLVFGKHRAAVRTLNAKFRSLRLTRQYEVLVAGHVPHTHGWVRWPLMMCVEHPPYRRVSTEAKQRELLVWEESLQQQEQPPPNTNSTTTAANSRSSRRMAKALLAAPKPSWTHYHVLERCGYKGNPDLPVTRMTLTSMTGRTHQLNVHCAAMGHPIVRDTVYGYQGSAAPHGGLAWEDLPADKASLALQHALAKAAAGEAMCVQAKLIRLAHPTTGETVEFTSKPGF